MYMTEMSGPNVSTGAAAQAASKKAAAGAAAANTASNVTAGGAAAPATAESPAYTISQSMESLLDNLTGSKPSAAASSTAAAAGGSGAGGTAGSATDSGKAGSGKQSATRSAAQAAADRAQQAQQIMQTALDQAKGGLGGVVGKAIDGMKKDLGNTLSSFGMSDDQVKDVLGGFGDHLNNQLKSMDFSQLAVNASTSASSWSIESKGIDLSIKDGERSISISFAKSTLDFTRTDQSLSAALNGDGSGSVTVGQSTTTATGKATGMIVRAEGFSEDEIKGVLEKLNGLASKGGMSGSGELKPSKSPDGILHLNLSLSQALGSPTGQASATAATDSAKKVDVTA